MPRVGLVTEPGRYMYKFGWLTITEEDLAVWHQFPDAVFTLVKTAPMAEVGRNFASAPSTCGIIFRSTTNKNDE